MACYNTACFRLLNIRKFTYSPETWSQDVYGETFRGECRAEWDRGHTATCHLSRSSARFPYHMGHREYSEVAGTRRSTNRPTEKVRNSPQQLPIFRPLAPLRAIGSKRSVRQNHPHGPVRTPRRSPTTVRLDFPLASSARSHGGRTRHH